MPTPSEHKTVSALSGRTREALSLERRRTRHNKPPSLSPLSLALSRAEPLRSQGRAMLRAASWGGGDQCGGELLPAPRRAPLSTAESSLPPAPRAAPCPSHPRPAAPAWGTGGWLRWGRWLTGLRVPSPRFQAQGSRLRDGRGPGCVSPCGKGDALTATGASELVYSDSNAGREKWMRKYSNSCNYL